MIIFSVLLDLLPFFLSFAFLLYRCWTLDCSDVLHI